MSVYRDTFPAALLKPSMKRAHFLPLVALILIYSLPLRAQVLHGYLTRNGGPIRGVPVSVEGGSSEPETAYTNALGYYFFRRVPVGQLRLVIDNPFGASVTRTITVPSEGTSVQTISLP